VTHPLLTNLCKLLLIFFWFYVGLQYFALGCPSVGCFVKSLDHSTGVLYSNSYVPHLFHDLSSLIILTLEDPKIQMNSFTKLLFQV
jgi:hypothetical protein